MIRTRAPAGLALAALVAACAPSGDAGDRRPASRIAPDPAVRPVPHAYLARPAEEDFWETLSATEAGEEFVLYVDPRIRTPAEGPWTATFRSADGAVVAALGGLRVDRATGRLTFLGSTRAFPPGDWTIELALEPGGVTHGPGTQTFRFRVRP